MEESNRMKRLSRYLFSIIDDMKKEARKNGLDIIDLGMGNPDKPAPQHVVDELCDRARMPNNHGYSRSIDKVECDLRQAIAEWYRKKFDVKLDPDTEIVPLIGSKEGIAHLSLAFLNNDDVALVPNPAYPVHFNGVLIAGGILHNLPLKEENGFLPVLEDIPEKMLKKSKLMFLSYPHNPTAAIAPPAFMKKAVEFARKHRIILANDLTYSDIVFDGHKIPSILSIPGAREVAIEFHTLSKSYNMAGWRIGFVVGNADILRSLSKLKGYIDFGLFKPIQYAAIKALSGPQGCVKQQVALYKRRRDVLVDALKKIGWDVPKPKATFYIWARIPDKYSALTSMEFVSLLIKEAGVAIAPGTGFGEYGEGYVRFALVEEEDRLIEAAKRIKKVLEMEA
ncbi:MAG: LL-diaminopimelate aminotransferase [Candidatus Omnitrophica bacterium]|nr:LL-diaminopimelate aminotransferase [Candidatus Omnitrophota bacterium]MBU1128679.1 LL-diaminopimelate aminotransferase [Candidatus Omnitrophota bacterium]MBU1785165.1 LL-diaminopimelate aminotransferase [Candidatus Omnitrophota bacterium]MBU1852191.1 LL-diaminopimelate aminotransferase [Candidatus Omnitrophota bacterium]